MKRWTQKWMIIPYVLLMTVTLLGCGMNAGGSRGADPIPLELPDGTLTAANNQFGLNLMKELMAAEPEENLLISPASIALALAMTYNGAEGETKLVMERTLQLAGMDIDTVNEGNRRLLTAWEETGEGVTLRAANSLWGREGITFRDEFIQANQGSYHAELTELDFDRSDAPDVMNQWVEKESEGLIPDIVEGPIDPNTILFLLNAVYFKGSWSEPFAKEETQESLFHIGPGKAVMVPLMRKYGEMDYKETDTFQAVRLPYGEEGRFRMAVVLPAAHQTVTELAAELADDPGAFLTGYSLQEGNLALPRWRMEQEYKLKPALSAMGMGLAFDRARAEFQGIAALPGTIYIEEVTHKTFLQVDEEGTEAAAATSVEIRTESARVPFTMTVDRPFLFLIEDEGTGALLFIGVIYDPAP